MPDSQLNNEIERMRLLWPSLIMLTVVVFQDEEHWLFQAREYDYCAAGATREQAARAFVKGFTADILMHATPAVAAPKPTPPGVWEELLTRDGATTTHFGFGEHRVAD